jgi:hypothetical protein
VLTACRVSGAPGASIPTNTARDSPGERRCRYPADLDAAQPQPHRPARAPWSPPATERPRSRPGSPAAAADSRPPHRTGSRPHAERPRTPRPAPDPGRRPAAPSAQPAAQSPETARPIAHRPRPKLTLHQPPHIPRTKRRQRPRRHQPAHEPSPRDRSTERRRDERRRAGRLRQGRGHPSGLPASRRLTLRKARYSIARHGSRAAQGTS